MFNVSAATVASVQAQQEHRDQYENQDQGKGKGIDQGEGTSGRPSSSSRFPRSPREQVLEHAERLLERSERAGMMTSALAGSAREQGRATL